MDDIQVLDPVSPMNPPSPQRFLAELLRLGATREFFVESMAKKMSYAEFMSVQIWDLLAEGQCFFADGTKMEVDHDQWFKVLKFVTHHLDGAAQVNTVNADINVYKIYMGIDESKL